MDMPLLFTQLPFFLSIPLTVAVYFGMLLLLAFLFGRD